MPTMPHRAKRSRYEQFVADNGDNLVKLAYAVSGDRDRAEDAVQEALTRVYRRYSRIEEPITYARRAVVNAIRDQDRRRVRSDRALRDVAQIPRPTADDPQDRYVTNSALIDALSALPEGQRAVIALRYGAQLSEAETAATLEISAGTVKSQTARALARMREVLSPRQSATHDLEIA